ncbi:MAG TPA: dihydrofolate reductase family protein [Rubrobacter sp.]|jgi:dihydrofolate reductase|nr:dihydrofolate reductase family protein [Rubrobacter sp.]
MGKVYLSLSMSLDGFITGPDPRPGEPMGDGGERLHEWMAGMTDFRERGETGNPDADVLRELSSRTGALLLGRTMLDFGEEPWGDDPPFGMPVFVVTHRPREPVTKRGGTTYIFVTDGLEAALERAQAAAGGKDVGLGGGASLAQQCLSAGLLDEIQVHLVPVLLGAGTRLFDHLGDQPIELERTGVVESPAGVTHLRFRVV